MIAAVLGLCLLGGSARASDRVTFRPGSPEGEALAFLKSMPREWSGTSDHDCHTYDDKNLERLSGAFIVAAAAFLKAFTQTHGAATITSAHRTGDEQECVCYGEKGPCAGKPFTIVTKKGVQVVKPVGFSRHQMGIAMDVRAGTGTENEFMCMQEFARANPQFGVYFPLGRADYPHMELVGSRGPAVKVASIAPTTTTQVGAAKITPCQKMKVMLTHDPVD